MATIAARILNSNNDFEEIKNKKWTVSVIDQEDKNAFVLPSGNIFVFTGKINSQYVCISIPSSEFSQITYCIMYITKLSGHKTRTNIENSEWIS